MTSPSVRSQTVNTGSGGASPTAITVPAGATVGDILLVAIETQGTQAAPAPSTLADWSTAVTVTTGAFGNDAVLTYWWRAVTGGEPASHSFTHGTTGSTGPTIVMLCIQGGYTATPFHKTASSSGSGTAAATAATVTPDSPADRLLITVHGMNPGGVAAVTTSAGTGMGGMVEIVDAQAQIRSMMAIYTEAHTTSSATGERTAVPTTTVRHGTATLLLNPTPGAFTNASAGHATGTGTAHDAGVTVDTSAGHATGTGTAHDATAGATTPATDADAGHATSTGTAYFDGGASISLELTADTQIATTGTAYNATVAVVGVAYAGSAEAFATAEDASVTSGGMVPDELLLSDGVSRLLLSNGTDVLLLSTSSAPTANPGHATSTGTAYNATVTSAATATAAASHAGPGTATAYDVASVRVALTGGQASATGTAHNATVSTAIAAVASAGLAAAVADAHDASIRVLTTAGFASVTVTGHPVGTGSGPDPFPVRIRHREFSTLTYRES